MMLLCGITKMNVDAFGTHGQGTRRIGAKVLQLAIRMIVAIPHVNGSKIIIIMVNDDHKVGK